MKKYLIASLFLIAGASSIVSCGEGKDLEKENESEQAKDGNQKISEEKKELASPRVYLKDDLHGVAVKMDYGSPSVKGRDVWGGLEPYGKVWRAGANETTSIEFDADIMVGETIVPAGKYGFYLIPNEDKDWVAILNEEWSKKEHDAWGAYNYDEEKDIVRINVTPEWTKDVQETLIYDVTESGISLSWEKMTLTVPIAAAE